MSEGPYMVELSCNGKPIQMEINTDASCTLMGKNDWEFTKFNGKTYPLDTKWETSVHLH